MNTPNPVPESRPKTPEASRAKHDEKEIAVILPPRGAQHTTADPKVRPSIRKNETDKSKKRRSSAKRSSAQPTSFRERLFRSGALTRPLRKRISVEEPASTMRISQVIASQPTGEKEWEQPEQKPMTGTSFREMNDYRRKLKAHLHVPTNRELKRVHVPYHVSLTTELEEDGFPDAANFIRHLIDFDDKRREDPEPDSLIQYEPKLVDNKPHLERLALGLREAAMVKIKGDVLKESNFVLQLAVYFTKETKEWWWIAQQLFERCISILEGIRTDGGRKEANARYCYGHFLLTQVKEPDKAKENLQIAYSLSSGKSWHVSEGPTHASTHIYINACNLLYEALVQTAIQIREKQPKAAVRLCHLAMRRAKEGGAPGGEARVMLELGICLMVEDIVAALQEFYRLLDMPLIPDNLIYICNAHLQAALCYKHLGNRRQALQHLETFKQIAEENDAKEQQAQVNRYLGEFHLNMDSGSLAKSYLETSFNIYLELGISEEIEQSRVLAAIGAGHKILPDYIHLIHCCGDPRNTDAFTKLLNWKISNVPFWVTDESASEAQPMETNEPAQS